jgi:phosphoadenosine phosphosulfate reductase
MASNISISQDSLAEWNQQLAGAEPEQILRWAAQRWGSQLALSVSFGGAAGMALLHMVAAVAPRTTVLYVDTALLFGETYDLIAQANRRYKLKIKAARPQLSLAEQAFAEGPALWEREPDRCCKIRKVAPLGEALAGYSAWVSGVRRSNGATRASAQPVEWSYKYNMVKLNPLVHWSDRELWAYVYANDVPYNPLLDRGYRSIGCYTCTSLPDSDDPRSGRWANFSKTECGLHVEPAL